jgi:energy-coupling factor transport system substrate-specific component
MRERLLVLLGLVAAAAALGLGFGDGQWVLAAIGLGGALVLVLAGYLESGPDSAKEVAVVATVSALAVAARLLVHPLPGVQPMTVIVIATGAAFGLRIGVAVGALGALVSNFFLLQGPWTPWQMLLWAACGAGGALARPLLVRRLAFALFAAVLGVAFSSGMDVFDWWYRYAHTWAGLTLSLSTGLPFSLAHGAGNLLIGLAVGPELRRMLSRFARRLHTEVIWDAVPACPPREAVPTRDASGGVEVLAFGADAETPARTRRSLS